MTTSSKNTPQQDFALIKRYLSGGMSAAEQHAFEAKMLEDPFLQDAVEGYAENPDWNWSKIAQGKPANFNWIYLLSAAVLCVAALVYFLLNKEQQPVETQAPVAENQQLSSPDSAGRAAIQIEEIRTSDSSVSILVSQTAPEKPNVTPEKYIQELDPETFKPIATIAAKPINSVPVPEGKTAEIEVSGSNQKIYHIKDYKVFDYRGIRLPIEKPQTNLGGTPASGQGNDAFETEIHEQKVNYVNYLEQSISLFSQADYKVAQQYFEQILKTYPDDLNALFYGGLCNYYNANYNEAIYKFQLVSTHSIPLFSDESAWYKAKALYKNNQKNEAIQLLNAIAASKSFYNTQAQNFLREVNNSESEN